MANIGLLLSVLNELGVASSGPAARFFEQLLSGAAPSPPPPATPPAQIIWQPGGVSAGNIFATWPEVQTAVAAVNGAADLWIDASIVEPVVIPNTANLAGNGAIRIFGLGRQVRVTAQAGARLFDVEQIQDLLIQQNLGALDPPLFQFHTVWNMRVIRSSLTTSGLSSPLAAILTVGNGITGTLFLDQGSSIDGQTSVLVQTGGTLKLHATRESGLTGFSQPATVVEAGATLNIFADASSPMPSAAAFGGVGTVTYTLIDAASAASFNDGLVAPPITTGFTTPGGPSIQDAIDRLKPFILPFTTADLGPGSILTVTHNKGVQYLSRIEIWSDGNRLTPLAAIPIVAVDANTVTFDLTTLGAFVGTWHASVGV